MAKDVKNRDRTSHDIRSVATKRGGAVPSPADAGYLAALKKRLRSKDRERILNSALEKFVHSESLKPYQAELIKLQRHLERTGRKMIVLFDGRDASGESRSILPRCGS